MEEWVNCAWAEFFFEVVFVLVYDLVAMGGALVEHS